MLEYQVGYFEISTDCFHCYYSYNIWQFLFCQLNDRNIIKRLLVSEYKISSLQYSRFSYLCVTCTEKENIQKEYMLTFCQAPFVSLSPCSKLNFAQFTFVSVNVKKLKTPFPFWISWCSFTFYLRIIYVIYQRWGLSKTNW